MVVAAISAVGAVVSTFIGGILTLRSARLQAKATASPPMPSSQLSAQQSVETVIHAYGGSGPEQYVFSKHAYEEFRRYEAQIALLEEKLSDTELTAKRQQFEIIRRNRRMRTVFAAGAGCAGILVGSLFGMLLPRDGAVNPGASPTKLTPSRAASAAASTKIPSVEASSATPPTSLGSSPSVDSKSLDVSGFDNVDFSSPSGNIWCRLNDESAFCKLPVKHDDSISKSVCGGSAAKGVRVNAVGSAWVCSADISSRPIVDTKSTEWHVGTGFGSARSGEWSLAILPYGKSLVHGDYLCSSSQNGMTCVNWKSGTGYQVSRSGVKSIAGQ